MLQKPTTVVLAAFLHGLYLYSPNLFQVGLLLTETKTKAKIKQQPPHLRTEQGTRKYVLLQFF